MTDTAHLCVLRHSEPTQAADGTYLCPGHRRWLDHALGEIVDTSALLVEFVEPGTSVDDGHQVHGKRVDPPAPVRLDVVALTDQRTYAWNFGDPWPGDVYPVLHVLASWARVVREERHLTTPEAPATIVSEVALLQAHAAWIAEQPWVDELATELRHIRSALHDAIGEHAPRPVGRCPVVHPEAGECGGPLYQDRYGALSVACRRCGEVWGETELRRLGLVIGVSR